MVERSLADEACRAAPTPPERRSSSIQNLIALSCQLVTPPWHPATEPDDPIRPWRAATAIGRALLLVRSSPPGAQVEVNGAAAWCYAPCAQ